MEHRIVVLHFAGQCPWLPWVIQQAEQAAAELGGSVEIIDVTDRRDLAEQHQLFFPFLTLIDDDIRISAPTPAAGLVAAVRAVGPRGGDGGTPLPASEPEPGLPDTDAIPDRIESITSRSVPDTCALCNAPSDGCRLKADWDDARGVIAYMGDQPVAAVEYLPAARVPYPLQERRDDAAFITCIYPTRNPDYRGAVLERLMNELPRLGYRRALVVAGRRTPFPNGPVEFFLRHGFREVGELMTERLRDTGEQLVLMERSL